MSQDSGVGASELSSHDNAILCTCAGRADATIRDDGKEAHFCGQDSTVKTFELPSGELKGDEIVVSDENGEELELTGISWRTGTNTVAYGDSNGGVRVLNLETKESELISRIPGCVWGVGFSKDGKVLAIATSTHMIRLVDMEDTDKCYDLKDHDGVVKSIAWDPKGEFIASVGSDGYLKIWDVKDWRNGNWSVVKSIKDAFPKDKETDISESTVWKVEWHPQGKSLALSGSQHIRILARATWVDSYLLKDGHGEAVSCVTWSPNGLYLVSTSLDMKVVAWDVTSKSAVSERKFSEKQQLIRWVPNLRGVISLGENGDFWILDETIGTCMPSPVQEFGHQNEPSSLEKKKELDNAKSAFIEDEAEDGGDDINEDDRNENGEDDKVFAHDDQSKDAKDDDDDVEMDDDENDLQKIREGLGLRENDGDNDEDEEDARDRAMFEEQLEAGENGGKTSEEILKQLEELASGEKLKQQLQKVKRQPAFQPGATDLKNRKRFLVWNALGIILSREDDTYSSVEIEFADMNMHRTIRFTDHYGLTMASLSKSGAFFASPGGKKLEKEDEDDAHGSKQHQPQDRDDYDQSDEIDKLDENPEAKENQGPVKSVLAATMEQAEREEQMGIYGDDAKEDQGDRDDTTRSTLFYRPFNSWTNNAEWILHLPSKEQTMAVACGESFCAAATNRRILRIFRPSGLQETPQMVPGPVVAMAAHGSLLLVVYHADEPALNGTQHMEFLFYQVGLESSTHGQFQCLAHGKVPLPMLDDHPLRWVSFADESMGCMPVLMDSTGMILALCMGVHWSWVPFLDTKSSNIRKSKHERCWPVSMSGGKLMAVMLKDKDVNQPRTDPPRPVLSSFNVELPIAGLEDNKVGTLKHKFEDATLREHLIMKQRFWFRETQRFESREDLENEIIQEEAKLDATILKHFVLAIKLGRSARALGLVRKLRTIKAVRIAHAQAQTGNAPTALIERIEKVVQIREAQEQARVAAAADEDEDEDEEDENDDEEDNRDDINPIADDNISLKSGQTITRKRTMASEPSLSQSEPPPAATKNPFAKKTNTPIKNVPGNENKKGLLSTFSVKSLEGVITPKLSRQSSFSKEARSSKKRRRLS